MVFKSCIYMDAKNSTVIFWVLLVLISFIGGIFLFVFYEQSALVFNIALTMLALLMFLFTRKKLPVLFNYTLLLSLSIVCVCSFKILFNHQYYAMYLSGVFSISMASLKPWLITVPIINPVILSCAMAWMNEETKRDQKKKDDWRNHTIMFTGKREQDKALGELGVTPAGEFALTNPSDLRKKAIEIVAKKLADKKRKDLDNR